MKSMFVTLALSLWARYEDEIIDYALEAGKSLAQDYVARAKAGTFPERLKWLEPVVINVAEEVAQRV